MADEPKSRSPWYKRFWDGLGHYEKLQTLWQLAVSFYVTSTTVSVLPGGWHPPQYWAVAGLAFFGAWAPLPQPSPSGPRN